MSGVLGGLIAAFPTPVTSSFESIATSGMSGTSSITFSSIPSTYKHLQIRLRTQVTTAGTDLNIRINGNTGANYSFHYLNGNGASVTASGSGGSGAIPFGNQSGTVANPNVAIVDFIDYGSTTKNKTIKAISGFDNNGSGEVNLASGAFYSTAAISSITILSNATWQTGSTVSLYGIKG